MKANEFKNLKVGDKVCLNRGSMKDIPCYVNYIWDVTDHSGYNEKFIGANFITGSNQKPPTKQDPSGSDLFRSYRAFRIIKEDPRKHCRECKYDGGQDAYGSNCEECVRNPNYKDYYELDEEVSNVGTV